MSVETFTMLSNTIEVATAFGVEFVISDFLQASNLLEGGAKQLRVTSQPHSIVH